MHFFKEPYTVPPDQEASGLNGGLESVKYYRPVVGIFHTFEKFIFGINPAPYKAVNLFLNAIVTILAFLVVLQLSKNKFIATAAAILYAVNPTKAEVVYWVYSDSHILVALFLLSSFLLYVKSRPILSLLIYVIALFSQENAVLLPFIILSYELLIRREGPKDSLLRLIPYFSLTAIYLAVRYFVVGGIPTGVLTIPEKILAATVLFQRYIKIYFVTDAPVTAYRYTPDIISFSNPETIISLLVVMAALCVFFILLRQKHDGAFWWVWFVVWLSVSMNSGGLGDYFMAEKGLYLSGLGLAVLVSYGLFSLVENRTAALAVVFAFSSFHAVQAYSRASYWKDTITYIESALHHDPNFAFYRYALGITYCENNRHQDAINMFLPLVQNKDPNPFYTLGLAESYFSLGNYIYTNTGDADAAIEAYELSLRYHKTQPRIYNNTGNIYLMKLDYPAAIEYYRKAIALDPQFATAFYNLGVAYQGLGQQAEAVKYFEKHRQLSEQIARQ